MKSKDLRKMSPPNQRQLEPITNWDIQSLSQQKIETIKLGTAKIQTIKTDTFKIEAAKAEILHIETVIVEISKHEIVDILEKDWNCQN